jgi:hypothetical protein
VDVENAFMINQVEHWLYFAEIYLPSTETQIITPYYIIIVCKLILEDK